MTAEEYQLALQTLDLSHQQAAKAFGVHERTSRRWQYGEFPVPRSVALVLRPLMHDLQKGRISVKSAKLFTLLLRQGK